MVDSLKNLKSRIFYFDSQLVSGSVFLFFGSMVANLGGYIYHLMMGRMLGPKDYGDLASLISLSYLLSIFSGTFLTTTIKFVTKYKVENRYEKIYSLFLGLYKIFGTIGLLIFLIFLFFKENIGAFLNLGNSLPIITLALWMSFGFISFINEAVLRSFLKFSFLSFNAIFSTLLKLIGAFWLVKIGLGINGALLAIFFASLFPFFVSFYPLLFLKKYKDKIKIEWKEFFKFSFPVLLTILGMTSLYSTDVILVKHFFSPLEAGLYSATSVLGKIVFFASGVVPAAMFPLVSERFENGSGYKHLLKQSFLIVGLVSFSVSLSYFLFPKLMINLLYGENYLSASKYLGIFAVFISFYSLSNLLVNFFLSTKRINVAIFCVLAALLQIILISFFHSSLFQIIKISLGISILLFLSLVILLKGNEKG